MAVVHLLVLGDREADHDAVPQNQGQTHPHHMKRRLLDIPILALALLGCLAFWLYLFGNFTEVMTRIVGILLASGFAFGVWRSRPLQLFSL